MFARFKSLVAIALILSLAACGDSNGNRNNAQPPPPPPNTTSVNVDLKSVEVIGGGAAGGTATASFTVNLDDSTVSGTVTLTGITADAVNLNQGFAGEAGPLLISLTQDSATAWSATDVDITQADLDALNAGGLYVEVTTANEPDGALRGQLVIGDIELHFAVLSGMQEVPRLTTAATGLAAITLNRSSGDLVIHVNTTDLDDAVAAHIHQALAGTNGGILVELVADGALPSHWFAEDEVLDAAGLDAFDSGELYVNVHSPANPGGEVRGQIITGDVTLKFLELSGTQEVPPLTSAATGLAAITLNTVTGDLDVHVNTSGLDDAIAAHVHEALAGTNGPVLVELMPDATLASHWLVEDAVLDAAGLDAFDSGALYVNVHSPANPPGELRGQIESDGVEIVLTQLTGGDVVPPVATANSGIAASTIDIAGQMMTTHVNLSGLDDALAVTVMQAPVGQNGVLVFDLAQNPNDLFQWSLVDQALSAGQYAALRSQGLYVTAHTPAFPNGEVRGQLEPEMSNPGNASTFVVNAVSPATGATVGALPANVVATFNRSLLAQGVSLASATLLASGGDGTFGDAQDLVVAIADVSASGSDLNIDLTGATNMDDVYQLTLDGSSAGPLTDEDGVVMDGDADGSPGGDFASTFTVETAAVSPTLTQIQTETFDVSCAVSGCHSGPTPAQGMDLSAGQAHVNIVDVPSGQNAMIDRVEPGDPDGSYLVQKIEGNAGSRMPLGQPALPNQQIQNIRDWILDGAQDN
ncbi:MAG: CHRD domain-containing protein [Gammaproteobacteria bacterium]|nr:CHRD domain-containing protein [Gammaproteobacteria bacterium]